MGDVMGDVDERGRRGVQVGDRGERRLDIAVERCVDFVIFRIFLVFLVVVFGRDQK